MEIEYMLKKIRFVLQANRCKKISQNELRKRMNGISGESTISQLENTIIPELNALIEQIHQNNLPSKEKRFVLSFALAFRDWGWNIRTPTQLFSALCALNDMYQNL